MRGRRNRITAQIGEFLACAALGKQGLIATPFAGNVPEFDVLVADERCVSVPIQVKASNSDNWPSDARHWMNIEYDNLTKTQNFISKKKISNPSLIYIFVSISFSSEHRDRFFILRKSDLQDICIEVYSSWMGSKNWSRPKNPESYDNRISISALKKFEDNWALISNTLHAQQGAAANP